MHELRILNGLHRGATLPLDHSTLIIGASEDADVVLVDPGIETRHAALTRTAAGWTLAMLDGTILSADSNRPCESLDLQFGDFARLGSIWITVAEAEARWSNPPPEPVDPPEEETIQAVQEETAEETDEAAEEEAQETALAQEALPDEGDLYRDAPEDGPMYAEQDSTPPAPPQPAAAPAPEPSRRKMAGWRRSRMVLLPFALVTVLSACAAYTITATSEKDAPLKTAAASTARSLPGSQPETASLAPAAKPEPIDLRAAFRQRLREVSLLNRIELDLRENAWNMHAALDDEEAARFERVLAQFIHTHNITFPVNAKIGSAEGMLPFRIRQVISGSNASIITHDGNRIYIGDTYRGLRLVSIQGNELRFDGERRIKVKW